MAKKRIVESNNGSDTLEFDYCDINDLQVAFPDGVKNVELCYASGVYRLAYNFYDNKFIKYFFVKSSSSKAAYDFAWSDAEIEELGLEPESCVDMVKSTDTLDIKLPDNTFEDVGKTFKKRYASGGVEHSKHYYDTVVNDKVGHGIFPPELFDAWSKRVLEHEPNSFVFMYDTVGIGSIIIPIKAAYKNHCRELDDIFAVIVRRVINVLPKEKRATFRAKPGLMRVFAYPETVIVTEYFRIITPKEESSLPELNDDDVTPIPENVFKESIREAIMEACRNYINHLKH